MMGVFIQANTRSQRAQSHPVGYVIQENGCWEWTGHIGSKRYGDLRVNGKRMLAHRWMWERENGAIPDGACVLHRCDNALCVRPGHLFLGTHMDNMRDMIAKGRTMHGDRHIDSKVSSADVYEMRSRYDNGERIKSIANDYPISRQQVSKIVHHECWTHLKETPNG